MTQKRRLAWALALLFVVNIAVISLAQQAEAATYRQGSSGEQVRIIQTKLKNWGYYDGAVDGIYGSQTAQAVKYFQRKNGLTADGIGHPQGAGHVLWRRGEQQPAEQRGAAGQGDLCRGPGRALQRPGGGGGGDPQPGGAPLLPQHHCRGGVPAGGLYLHGGRAV
jgi:hypothetical protein